MFSLCGINHCPSLFFFHFLFWQINNTKLLQKKIDYYFSIADANKRIREQYGNDVIDIPGHETVLRPKKTLQRLCDHLGVTCSEDYIEKCSQILFDTPSFTRHTVVWTKGQIQRVTKKIMEYSFLEGYSFDKYPSWLYIQAASFELNIEALACCPVRNELLIKEVWLRQWGDSETVNSSLEVWKSENVENWKCGNIFWAVT